MRERRKESRVDKRLNTTIIGNYEYLMNLYEDAVCLFAVGQYKYTNTNI
jgi:hypothetical protein